MPVQAYPQRALTYRDLTVWQRGLDLVVLVYRLTKEFPGNELYGLTSQMRRAVTSIPANIAEGQGRRRTGEFLHFLGVARGSLFELETHSLAAHRLDYLGDQELQEILDHAAEIGRMLAGLIRSLERSMPRSRRSLATSH